VQDLAAYNACVAAVERRPRIVGRGDLLFGDIGEPIRLQSTYVIEEELETVTRP
jgi:DNA segregation ATPase FtsK/SpoIIIE-like protein